MSTEIIEQGKPEEVKTAEEPKANDITRDVLKEKGWSADEIKVAEKRGYIKQEEKQEENQEEQKAGPEKEQPAKQQVSEEKKEQKKEFRSDLPDFTISDPEKERVFLETFGPGTPQRAMYLGMKRERKWRQDIQRQLEAERAAKKELEGKLNPALQVRQEVDESGNVIDPEDKPLTLKALRELQKEQQELTRKQQEEIQARAAIVRDAQEMQEEYVRAIYPDWDDAAKKAEEIIKEPQKFFKERWKQLKVANLMQSLAYAAANADKFDVEDYHGALLVYELGKMHPEFEKGNGHGPIMSGSLNDQKDPKANGGLTPEQMKRIEKNSQKGASSASVTGNSGKRALSADDIGLLELNKMSREERTAFKKENPRRYESLMRGG